MTRKLLPITIVTVQLDHEDRLRAIEKRLGIKIVQPFEKRSRKYRKPTVWVCKAGLLAHVGGAPCPECRIKK